MRIKNQYLIAVLSLIIELGAKRVSSANLVQAWRNKGRLCDDVFFLHYDTLFSYRFLKKEQVQEQLVALDELLRAETVQDYQFSITDEGLEFLHRYG